MSLLMDALRKAEEAKRQADEHTTPQGLAGVASELTLAPLNEPAPTSPPPDPAQHVAALDAEFASAARATPARQRAPTAAASESTAKRSAERSSVRNAFAAKAPPRPRRALWLVLALAGVAAVGLGAYFWWQLQSLSGGSRPVPTQAPPTAQTPATLPAPAPTVTPAPLAATLRSAAPNATTPQPSAAPSAREATALFVPRTQPPRPSPATGSMAPASPLRLSRSAPKSGPTIERAYDGLQAGRLDEAQRDYEQVLRSDAKNTDALLGLATIAARQGQAELAQGYYLRALESDPYDATAQAGLINTRGQADPGLSESRLKSALAGQPDSSALHFALGNLYARQSRWSDAQQAYFRAYSGEPDNADIVFNLAVSLDHLHQNRLAAQYYQMALNSPGVQHSSFDKNQVKQRILELQP